MEREGECTPYCLIQAVWTRACGTPMEREGECTLERCLELSKNLLVN